MSKLKFLAVLSTAFLPWVIRRPLLQCLCGYRIHRTASLSRFSLIVPERLHM